MQRFKNILFVAAEGAGQEQAFARALTLVEENQAALTVMDVVDEIAGLSEYPYPSLLERMQSSQKMLIEERRNSLRELAAEASRKIPGIDVSTDVREGRLFIEVIRAVLENQYDLVMKAANSDMGRMERLFGSADLKLLRKCPCPVWIVKPSEVKHFNRILAAVDPTPGNPDAESLNRLILDLATSLAGMENSELDVIHAWEVQNEVALRSGHLPPGTVEQVLTEMREAHQKEMDELLSPYGEIGKNLHLVKGDAGHAIIDLAMKNNIDLIVMGTVGRSGIPGLVIGNTAEKVIHNIDCSVLAVKPEGFVTPVDG